MSKMTEGSEQDKDLIIKSLQIQLAFALIKIAMHESQNIAKELDFERGGVMSKANDNDGIICEGEDIIPRTILNKRSAKIHNEK
jgi:hypothetical protein